MAKYRMGAAGLLATLLVAGAAHGETIFGIYAGAGTWQQHFSGDVASGVTDIDVERDLDIKDETNNVFYAAVEHGVPVLPNLRVNYAAVSGSGRNTLTRSVEFNGQVFNLSDDVAANLDLSQTDAVLYYELLDNFLSVDVGMAFRWVDGSVEVASAAGAGRAKFQGVLPLLYGRTRVDLPLTGLWVGAEIMGIAYSGDQLLDANAQVGWESPVGIGAELGWRSYRMELDSFEDIDAASLNVSGPYAALNFHF